MEFQWFRRREGGRWVCFDYGELGKRIDIGGWRRVDSCPATWERIPEAVIDKMPMLLVHDALAQNRAHDACRVGCVCEVYP